MVDDVTTGFKLMSRRRRSGFGIIGWIIGTVVIGGMLVATLLPSLCRPRESANKAKCASNLHQIGLAISLYAEQNGGQYPPSLAVLMKNQRLVPAVMICPSSNDEIASDDEKGDVATNFAAAEKNEPGHKRCLSYIYNGRGLNTATAPATAIVAYEPPDNHDGDGTNVLFGDGHAEWIGRHEWPKVAAAGGVVIVQTPTTRP